MTGLSSRKGCASTGLSSTLSPAFHRPTTRVFLHTPIPPSGGTHPLAGCAPPEEREARALIITFRAEPGVNATRAMRALLKVALRRFGLRCIGIAAGERE